MNDKFLEKMEKERESQNLLSPKKKIKKSEGN